MAEIKLPYRGLGRGTVPVPQVPDGTAVVVEVKGFLLAGDVRGVIDTPDRLEQGDVLCGVHLPSRQRVRGIVPLSYTHVRVEPAYLSRSRNGIHWWRLGFRAANTCLELAGTMGGRHDDVFRYLGPVATCRLAVSDGYLRLEYHSMDGTRRESLVSVEGPYRGQFKIPGPGLIQARCRTSWSATVECG
jgi:hypothetical protein